MSAPEREPSRLRAAAEELRRRSALTATEDAARRQRDGLERLYVYWLASVVLLIVLAAGPALLLRGALSTQGKRIEELGRRVEELGAARETGSGAASSAPMAHGSPAAAPMDDESDGLPEPAADDRMGNLLRRAIGEEAVPPQVIDEQAAEEALSIAEQQGRLVRWGDGTWIRLAMLARLCELDDAAGEWIARANRGNRGLDDFWQLSARVKLVEGELAEATRYAQRIRGSDAAGAAGAIQAAIAARRYDYAGIRDGIFRAGPFERLAPEYRLLVARACIEIDELETMRAALPAAERVPDVWRQEWQFLSGACLILEGRLVEGVAALEALGGMSRRERENSNTRAAAVRGTRRSTMRPDSREAEFWQLRARGALDPGRVVTEIALRGRERPEDWWLAGVGALRGGQVKDAEFFARGALSAEPDYIPALLLLARAFQETDDAAALQMMSRARQLDWPRAETNVLITEYHAAKGERGATANSVRQALGRNAALIARFLENKVIRGVLSEDELLTIASEVKAEDR